MYSVCPEPRNTLYLSLNEHGLAGGGAVAVAVISAVLNNMQATCYEELAETTGNMLCGTEKTGNVLHAERTETTGNML